MFEKEAEEVTNKKLCANTMCYNHCSFNSPKHHRCGQWHKCYEITKECMEFGYNKGRSEAKEIIRELVDRLNGFAGHHFLIVDKAEQFIRETE